MATPREVENMESKDFWEINSVLSFHCGTYRIIATIERAVIVLLSGFWVTRKNFISKLFSISDLPVNAPHKSRRNIIKNTEIKIPKGNPQKISVKTRASRATTPPR